MTPSMLDLQESAQRWDYWIAAALIAALIAALMAMIAGMVL